jgi:hypothetical protein
VNVSLTPCCFTAHCHSPHRNSGSNPGDMATRKRCVSLCSVQSLMFQKYARKRLSLGPWDTIRMKSLNVYTPAMYSEGKNYTCNTYRTHMKLDGLRWLSRYSDSLQAGQTGDRFPVGARFSAPVQTGPGDNPASYTMGTGSFPGVKRPGRGVDHTPHLAPLLSLWAFVACCRVSFTFTFYLKKFWGKT